MEIGNRIREEREAHGLSQEDLAREIFVSRQTVSNWETGKTYPDVQSLLLISSLFETSIDSLVKGDMEAMQVITKNYEKDRFVIKVGAWLMVAFIVFGAVMLALATARYDTSSAVDYVLAAIPLLAAIAISAYIERIKKRLDVDTMREIAAFLDGADPDEIEHSRTLPTWHSTMLKVLLGATIAILLMLVISSIIALTMFH